MARGRISLTLAPPSSGNVKQIIQKSNMFLKLICVSSCLSLPIYSDSMGEEHHIRRTARVPPFMVVVSAFLLYFTASLTMLKDKYIFHVCLALFGLLSWNPGSGVAAYLIIDLRAPPHLLIVPLPACFFLCFVVFSGTCIVQLQREETRVSTPARPRLSTTTWVSDGVRWLGLLNATFERKWRNPIYIKHFKTISNKSQIFLKIHF